MGPPAHMQPRWSVGFEPGKERAPDTCRGPDAPGAGDRQKVTVASLEQVVVSASQTW